MQQIRFSPERIKEIVNKFNQISITVVGDIMVDEYLWGDVRRISPEAPVPVVHVESVTRRLGGAANVVQNLQKLGIKPILISVCGDDENGRTLLSLLEGIDCSQNGIYVSSSRPTTIKTRIIARNQQIVRADHELVADLNEHEHSALERSFDATIDKVQGIIVSDYGKGVVSPSFISSILQKSIHLNRFVAIDPKERHFNLYKGVSVITPNLKEAHSMAGLTYKNCSDEEVRELGWKLVDELNLPYLLITLSERGMALFERNERNFTHLPTVAQKVFDVTGAGDTVISVFSAAFTSGASPLEAAFLANHAAGLTVAELGTASVDPQTLIKECLLKS
ncbi:MAG: D-glycero-beta-D-manno-heptose-7-phosphate kinase [Fibrobacter sp.]|nr:D-glycero-beta-D-manno-heptose-7-phosphate kinase [Fibrobacter sp.]